MAFSNLFRRYSAATDTQSPSYAYMEGNSIAETLLEELESQCRNSLAMNSTQKKRGSETFSSTINRSIISNYGETLNVTPTARHSSVDYSWLTPKGNLLQSTGDTYHLPDIIKMELSELILNVLAEDCTLIINKFRREVRESTKPSTPENVIALFRKTICDYIDEKPKNRTNTNNNNDTTNTNVKPNNKSSTGIYSMVRNNRINPKRVLDEDRHCIAELTEISITSSSNDGAENAHAHS